MLKQIPLLLGYDTTSFGEKKTTMLHYSGTGKEKHKLSSNRNLKASKSLRRSAGKGRDYLNYSWPMLI